MGRWPGDKWKWKTFEIVGYHPNTAQVPIHRGAPNLLQIIGAEGAGKSRVTAEEVVACSSLPHWAKLVYLVGEKYVNTLSEFEYIERSYRRLGILDRVSKPNEGKSPWVLHTKGGTRVQTVSVKEGTGAIIARGEAPDITVLCEAGRIKTASVLTG